MSDDRAIIWIVLHPFESYTKGQMILDRTEFARLQAAGQGSFVVATSLAAVTPPPSSKSSGN